MIIPTSPHLVRPHPGKKGLVCTENDKEALMVATGIEISPGTKVRCGRRVYTGQVSSKFQKDISQPSFSSPEICDSIRDSISATFDSAFGAPLSLREHARARSFVPDENLSAFDSCSRGPDGCDGPLRSSAVLHPREVPRQVLARVRGGQGGC